MLRIGDNWCSYEEILKNEAVQFFKHLYQEDTLIGRSSMDLGNYFPPLEHLDIELLDQPIRKVKIKFVLFAMGPLKVQGLDGFPVLFYQNQWSVVGHSLCAMVNNVFDRGEMSNEINFTGIVLIPKVDHPETLSQFRPINLYNVRYKIITKLVANRLKSLMPKLIGPIQSSFALGRHIIDNIVIAQETIHLMNKKVDWIAIKVDLEKAYDKLRWAFIEEMLEVIGIPEKLRKVIMHCITSSSMRLIWNGQPTEEFLPTRGIR